MTGDSVLLRLLDRMFQLWGLVRGRPLLHVRILEDKSDQEVGGLRFEVENRRRNVTSLDPSILVTYHWPGRDGWQRRKMWFRVRDLDRQLDPFKPKVLSASADELSNHYWLSWFRTYRFRPTSGVTTRVRLRNTLLDPISAPRFAWEFLRLRVLNKPIEAGGAESYSEWQRKKRARGPH